MLGPELQDDAVPVVERARELRLRRHLHVRARQPSAADQERGGRRRRLRDAGQQEGSLGRLVLNRSLTADSVVKIYGAQ